MKSPIVIICLLLSYGILIIQGISTSELMNDSQQNLENMLSSLRNIMNYNYYETEYGRANIKKSSSDDYATKLKAIKSRIENLVAKKQELVNNIRLEAESAYLNHNLTDNNTCKFPNFVSYHRAKAINTSSEPEGEKTCQSLTYFPLKEDPLMWNIYDNRANATAHVPTNVYDGSIDIQNVANWTSSLRDVFLKNVEKDPTQKWQYFGSTTGYFLIYPGIMWHILIEHALSQSTLVDFFDCRSQNWYLEASSSPRDIVIIVDRSGSMKGRRNIIANHTVYEILNTLTENDFFNIILFNDSIAYADSNINNRLVQATNRNKDWMIQQLTTQFHPMGIAMYQKGIEEAFKLLSVARKNSSATTSASQSIMIISDGAPNNYEYIFDQYNPEKEVRVFTYLIGQAVTEDKPVKEMACNNKGYAVTISTLADVKENVQKYLDVIARIPYGEPERFTIWTAIHEDQMSPGIPQNDTPSETPTSLDSNGTAIMDPTTSPYFAPTTIYSENVTQNSAEKYRMFVSVGQAVYNLKQEFPKDQISRLLGVAGIDVPVSDFTRLAYPWELGVGGYIFAITNNGFFLFHPELRPMTGNRLKSYYENVDIAEIIIPVNKSTEPPIYAEEIFVYNTLALRENMIKRMNGVETLKVLTTTTPFSTSFEHTYKFYYDKIENTPYSLGLAIPQDLNLKTPEFTNTRPDLSALTPDNLKIFSNAMVQGCEFINSTSGSGVLLSPFLFCEFDANTTRLYMTEPICALREVLLNAAMQTKQRCITDYLVQAYRDAEITREAEAKWREEWQNAQVNEIRKKLKVSQAISLHYSGLIRFYNEEEPLYKKLISENKLGSQGSLYKETVFTTKLLNKGSGTLIFTPKSNENVNELLDFNESVPTVVSTEVLVNDMPVAVLAAQIDTEALRQLLNESKSCDPDNDCFLVNSAGLIVASVTKPRLVGLPLNAYDCNLMEDLVKNKVFESYFLYDFQGTCIMTQSTIASFASRIFSPIANFMSSLMTFLLHLGTFLSELSINSIWMSLKVYADEVFEYAKSFNSMPSQPLGATATNETLIEIQRATIELITQKARADLLTCFNQEEDQCVRKHITQNCVGINKNAQNCSIYCRVAFSLYPKLDMKDCKQPDKPCTKYYTAFRALPGFTNLGAADEKTYCTNTCIRKWSGRYIKRTNLIFLVLQRLNSTSCSCHCESQYIYYEYGIMLKINGSGIIETSRAKPPWHEAAIANIPKNESATKCSSGQLRLAQSFASVCCQLLLSLTFVRILLFA